MPQKCLHGADVNAAFQQVRGKGVAQGMAGGTFGDAGFFNSGLELTLQGMFMEVMTRNPARSSTECLASFLSETSVWRFRITPGHSSHDAGLGAIRDRQVVLAHVGLKRPRGEVAREFQFEFLRAHDRDAAIPCHFVLVLLRLIANDP